jgi:replicative DNA helicase
MKPLDMAQWQETSDYVLAPMVAESMIDNSNAHYWRANQANILAYHFPDGKQRLVFKAVAGLILQSKPVHITTLQHELNGSIPAEYLPQLYTMYQKGSTLSGGVFDANLDTVKSYGERFALVKKLQAGIEAMTIGGQGIEVDNVISQVVTGLISSSGETIENETAEQMASDFAEYMSVEPRSTMTTGIQLVDGWIGGLAKGDFMAIAAPMKQRKTSLVLNMLIHMARCGHSVALMMLESNKQMVNAMIVSMLAIEYLMKNKAYNADIQGGKANQIWASSLVKMRARYRLWQDIRVAAVDYGIAEFRKLEQNLRVYDRTKAGGSLLDSASIHRVCLRDKALYNTDFIAIDHAQRIHVPGVGNNDYEKLTAIVPYLEGLARREEIAMCLLAQLKAGESEGTGDSHIAGVRGGTVLDEAVDYMLITGYKQKAPDDGTGTPGRLPNDVLMIGLQHSRYGDGGSHKRQYVALDPNSGLIPYGGRALSKVSTFASDNILNPNYGINLSDLE